MIVWKFSFCSLHFQRWFQFLEKTLIWFKKVSSVKKLPISDGESFLESIFDLNWTCKILLTQSCYIWNFNAADLFYIFLKRMEKCFDNIQNVKKLKFEADWAELRPKICLFRQSWAKYLEQNREIQENWTGQEKFDICFCVLFECYCQSLICWRETGY